MSEQRSRWKGPGCAALLLVLILVGAALTAWIFQRIESWPARTAREVSKAFAEVAHLQPKITIRDRVFFEQTVSVLELAVVSRETQVEREMMHEWLGSKKRIKLRGVFIVRAGFDLTEPFSVHVEGRQISTELPAPKILSVEQKDIEVLAYENGLWNRIAPPDLEAELRALPILARQKAAESRLHKEALEVFSARLREKFAPDYGVAVTVPPPLD
ncbi:MAG: DUF4230 domain-containing protein [Verrucomicrobiota bacterium]|nr:DUF4230 domain-containing protein [Verrucomicrobiota bacterium]